MTHQLQFLREVEHVIVMEIGRIKARNVFDASEEGKSDFVIEEAVKEIEREVTRKI